MAEGHCGRASPGTDDQGNHTMKHLNDVSRAPMKAQTGICENFQSDLQVKLCFLIQILTSFILPLENSKNGNTTV